MTKGFVGKIHLHLPSSQRKATPVAKNKGVSPGLVQVLGGQY